MNIKARVELKNGKTISGWLTTDHAASSYGQPVFVDDDGQAYNWLDIKNITTTAAQSRGGQSKSSKKAAAARISGRKGGRPRKNG